MSLSKKFQELKEEIVSTPPTVLTLRDWAETLADLCDDLALMVERMEGSTRRANEIASQLANGIKPD